MANYVLTNPLTYTPASDPSYFRFEVLPPIVECPRYPTLNFVDSRARSWNCQPFCGADSHYFSLYKVGDIIPIQLNLPDVRNINNTGTRRPQVGWRQSDLINNFWYVRAEIYDYADCTTPLFSLVDDFCTDWWVGYSDRVGAIQTLFIDSSLLGVSEGFLLKIVTINDSLTDEITLWSEPFLRIDKKADCKGTVLVQSTYNTIDCENRDYRKPNNDYTIDGASIYAIKTPFSATGADLPAFYSSWRYEAEVIETGNGSEQTLNDNDIIIRQKVIRNYELQFTRPIPPYAYDILTAQLRGASVQIDGDEFVNFGDINKELEGSRMFIPNIPMESICDLKNLRC